MRRLPAGFANPSSGRPGMGPRGTTTRPSMKDYRLRPLQGRNPRESGDPDPEELKPKMTFRASSQIAAAGARFAPHFRGVTARRKPGARHPLAFGRGK